MKRKYLLLPLMALVLGLAGCRIITQPASLAPSDLTGQIVSSSEISLTWKDNSADEKGFYIYRKTTDNYSRIGVVLADANSYNDKGLDPEATYTYKVTAYNDSGESESSNEITITTMTEEISPSAPSDLAAIAIAYNQIDLSWQDNSDNENGFRVQCNIWGGVIEIADLPANTTSFSHSGLEPLEKYQYYVQAYNGAGVADSNIAEATTLSGVEILDYELNIVDCVRDIVWGHAQSNIPKTLDKVEITSYFYDENDMWLGFSINLTYDLPALAIWYFGCEDFGYDQRHLIDYVIVEVTEVDIK